MAIKQRSVLSTQNTTLSTNKDTAFPDNNNKEITAADLRTWLDELLSQVQDILDSYFNKLDELRITSTLSYDIVATPTDWNGGTAPATQNLVNDELADRIKTIEIQPNQTAFETPYTPTTSADWLPEGTPSEVKGALDILADRTFVNKSLNFAVLDSINGNDTTADVGTFLKPYKTGNAAFAAIPSGGTVIVLEGSTTSFSSLINKPANIIGFGENTTIGSVQASQGTAGPIVVMNLNLFSTTSLRVQGNSQIIGYNLKGNNITQVTGGGSFKLYNCEFDEVVTLIYAKNCVFNGVVSTKIENVVNIENNTFKDSFTISDKTGGNIKNNTFDTVANTPLLWSKGFNASQAGGKIDIYNNTFIGTSTDVILEIGTKTASMTARIWNNQYEQSNLLNITVNTVTRNQLNTLLV